MKSNFALPLIYQVQKNNLPHGSVSRSLLLRLPLLAIILILAVFLLQKYTPLTLPQQTRIQSQPLSGGKILLLGRTEANVGQTVPINIRVSTGGWTTDGTDVVIKYDPRFWEIDQDLKKSFIKGAIYSQYPPMLIDNKAGTIRLSGVTTPNSHPQGFNGIGNFGTLNLKAKSLGTTTVSIDFRPNATDESNIVESRTSKDILQTTQDLKLTIK